MNRFCFALIALLSPWLVYAGSPGNNWPDLAQPAPAQGGGEKDSALIIGITDYIDLPKVPGATDNAREWFTYLTKTRKLDPVNVFMVLDKEARAEFMKQRLENAVASTMEGGTLWVIFVGHGFAGEDKENKTGLLVGVDAISAIVSLNSRSLSQDELFKQINKGKQARSIVVLDACFSGKTPDGKDLLTDGTMVPTLAVDPDTIIKRQAPKKELIVFTATDANEYAGPLPGTRKPAFSYLILGALRGWASNGDGKVTADEALTYAAGILRHTENGRSQTPQLKGSKVGSVVLSNGNEPKPDPTFDPLVTDPSKVDSAVIAPKVEMVKIKITSNPKDAQILVDNLLQGVTPAELPFTKGDRVIKIKVASRGYETSEEIEVSLQQDSENEFSLKELPPEVISPVVVPTDPPFNPTRVLASGALGVGAVVVGVGAITRSNKLCGNIIDNNPPQINAAYIMSGAAGAMGISAWMVADAEPGEVFLASLGATGAGLLLSGVDLIALKCPKAPPVDVSAFEKTFPAGLGLVAASAVDFAVWGIVRAAHNKKSTKDKKTSSLMIYPQGLGATLQMKW